MVWLLVAGLVLAGLVVLVAVTGSLRRRLAELDRVAALVQERTMTAQRRIQARAERLQATAEQVRGDLATVEQTRARLRRPPG